MQVGSQIMLNIKSVVKLRSLEIKNIKKNVLALVDKHVVLFKILSHLLHFDDIRSTVIHHILFKFKKSYIIFCLIIYYLLRPYNKSIKKIKIDYKCSC